MVPCLGFGCFFPIYLLLSDLHPLTVYRMYVSTTTWCWCIYLWIHLFSLHDCCSTNASRLAPRHWGISMHPPYIHASIHPSRSSSSSSIVFSFFPVHAHLASSHNNKYSFFSLCLIISLSTLPLCNTSIWWTIFFIPFESCLLFVCLFVGCSYLLYNI